MSLSQFQVTDDFIVSCFYRKAGSASTGPWFAVREWDQKVIRKSGPRETITEKQARSINRSSEQAIRASIRQVVLHMGLRAEAASREEVRLLKSHNVIGKRAPSCSLLNGPDMVRLLCAFGKEDIADQLRCALRKTPSTSSSSSVASALSPLTTSDNNSDDEPPQVVLPTSSRRRNANSGDWETKSASQWSSDSATSSSATPLSDNTSACSSPTLQLSPTQRSKRRIAGTAPLSKRVKTQPSQALDFSGLDALLVAAEQHAASSSSASSTQAVPAVPIQEAVPARVMPSSTPATSSSESLRYPQLLSAMPALFYPPLGFTSSVLSSPLSRMLLGYPSLHWHPRGPTSPMSLASPSSLALEAQMQPSATTANYAQVGHAAEIKAQAAA